MAANARIDEQISLRAPVMDDLEAVVAVYNACSMAAVGVNEHRAEDMRTGWSGPDFKIEEDARVAVNEAGEIVGYVAVKNRMKPHVRVWTPFAVHPDYGDTRVGDELLAWAVAEARSRVDWAPPGTQVAMFTGALEGEKHLIAYAENAGFKLERYFLMMKIEMDAPPPEPVWPEGIRPTSQAEYQDDWAAYMAVDDAFQDHWGYVEPDHEEEFKDWMHWLENDPNYDPALWYMAVDDAAGKDTADENGAKPPIAGMSFCAATMPEDPEMAYIEILGVRRPWRKRGLGLALMHYTFGEFYRRGVRKVALHVDASSLTGATRLYEKAGMHEARRSQDYMLVLREGEDLSTQTV